MLTDTHTYTVFENPVFDLRDSKSVKVDLDIFVLINEYVEVTRNGATNVRL